MGLGRPHSISPAAAAQAESVALEAGLSPSQASQLSSDALELAEERRLDVADGNGNYEVGLQASYNPIPHHPPIFFSPPKWSQIYANPLLNSRLWELFNIRGNGLIIYIYNMHIYSIYTYINTTIVRTAGNLD